MLVGSLQISTEHDENINTCATKPVRPLWQATLST